MIKDEIKERLEALESISEALDVLMMAFDNREPSPEEEEACIKAEEAVGFLRKELLAEYGKTQLQIEKTREELENTKEPLPLS